MKKEKTLKEIEKVTKGKSFISYEKLDEIEFISYVYLENCGTSGTGRGILYTLYLMDENGNKTDEELGELVVIGE